MSAASASATLRTARGAEVGWGLPSWLVAFCASVFVGAAAGLGPLVACAGLAVVCFGIVVLFRPLIGACTLAAVVPAVAGIRRGLPVPGFRLAEIAIVGVAALILLSRRRGEPVRWVAFDWLALAYAAATALLGAADLLQRGAPFSSSNVGTLIGPLQFFLLYRAVRTGVTTSSGRAWGLRLILLASIPVSALALAQEVGVPGVRPWLEHSTTTDSPGAFAHYLAEGLGRATGPFDHPHTLGAFLLIVILICVGLLLDDRQAVLPRWGLLAVLAVALCGQASTFTATPVLATVAGSVALGVWFRSLGKVVYWISIGAAIVALVFGPSLARRAHQQYQQTPTVLAANSNPLVPQTLAYRYSIWKNQYVPVMSGHWLTGYGPDVPAALPGTVPWKFSENLYISLVLRGGVPLLLIFAGLMSALFVTARRKAGSVEPEVRVVSRVVAILVVLLVGMHLIEPYFIGVGMTHLFWALCGLMLARTSAGTSGSRDDGALRSGAPSSAPTSA
ncbi:MAG: O-antigen ligase family protein [Actinomycetota bacterium]|nr:O-antigen ligase family protein [Actinomycetota bacterium]